MYTSRITFLFLAVFSFMQLGCAQQRHTAAFYNVENLFDTIDDPITLDEEFTPDGKKKWTTERYQDKLNKIAQVMDSLGGPAMIGLVEVENKKVLEDLVANTSLSRDKYGIVHQESPDRRGIDVAFIYKKKVFKVSESDIIRITFPKEIAEDYTSRDILYIKGKLSKKDELHIFVNHWPSRRGGLAASEPKRLLVAKYLKKAVNAILQKDEKAKILIMGDFNDEPQNLSLSSALGALPEDTAPIDGLLYNYFYGFQEKKKGSYNYRGNWNMLDQFIVSSGLRDSSSLHVENPVIFSRPWMMYKSGQKGESPSRTYGGPNYYGGYSDHLPISIDLVKGE